MTKKSVYSGVIAGIMVSVIGIYPLVVALPKAILLGNGLGSVVVGFGVVAGLIVIEAGRRASNGAPTRMTAIQGGAMVGGIVGLMLFAALGAAAAAIVALKDVLLSDPPWMPILQSETLIRLTTSTYVTLWNLTGMGTMLGAVGAAFSPLQSETPKPAFDGRLTDVITTRFLLTSSLMLGVTASVVAPMSMANANVSLFSWPTGSAYALFVIILLWKLRHALKLMAHDRHQQARVNLMILGVVPLVMLGALMFTLRGMGLMLSPVVIMGNVIGVAVSVFSFSRLRLLSNTQSVKDESEDMRQKLVGKDYILMFALCGGATFAVPALMIIPLTLDVLIGLTPIIQNTSWTAMDVIRNLFRWQAMGSYGIFLIGAGSVVFGPLLLGLFDRSNG